jgi:hypothetical protein
MPRKQRFKPSRKPKPEMPPTQPETQGTTESELMTTQPTGDSQSEPPTSAER